MTSVKAFEIFQVVLRKPKLILCSHFIFIFCSTKPCSTSGKGASKGRKSEKEKNKDKEKEKDKGKSDKGQQCDKSKVNEIPRIAINGFGRIGRMVMRVAAEHSCPLEV